MSFQESHAESGKKEYLANALEIPTQKQKKKK
jgi:hypothetical protein